jgi:hypothetical protein
MNLSLQSLSLSSVLSHSHIFDHISKEIGIPSEIISLSVNLKLDVDFTGIDLYIEELDSGKEFDNDD